MFSNENKTLYGSAHIKKANKNYPYVIFIADKTKCRGSKLFSNGVTSSVNFE